MLALKKALIKVDPIPVLIFDEIDAQIGGRLGTITGKKLKELSSCRQVILITHLPQIASFADRHFKVSKSVKAGRATTEVLLLEGQKRVEELAQMMSGANTTKIPSPTPKTCWRRRNNAAYEIEQILFFQHGIFGPSASVYVKNALKFTVEIWNIFDVTHRRLWPKYPLMC